MNAIVAPSRGPPETAGMQGKCLAVRGPCPLGAAMESSAFFFLCSREKYCPNGGMALRRQLAVGAVIAPSVPLSDRQNRVANPQTSGGAGIDAHRDGDGLVCLRGRLGDLVRLSDGGDGGRAFAPWRPLGLSNSAW